jgi:PAS domain S-box-containing protein
MPPDHDLERELAESSGLFKSFFDESPVGKSMTSADGRLVYTNAALGKMLGYSREDLMKLSMADITHPDDLPESRECVRSLFAGERDMWDYEKRYIAKDGRTIWAQVVTRLVRGEDGKPRCLATYVQDITERKRIQEALAESENMYKTLFRDAQMGMFGSKLDGSALLAVNRKLCEMFGYSEEEMLANPATIHWVDPVARENMVAELRQKGSLFDYIVDFIRKGGEIHTAAVSMRLNTHQGYLEGSAVDITEERKVEQKLAESEKQFRSLVETMNEGLAMQDKAGLLTYANPRLCALLGYTSEEIVGKPWKGLFDEEALRVLAEQTEMRKGDKGGVYEIPWKTKTGQARHVLIAGSPIRDSAGNFTGSFGVITDITERKRAELDLIAALADLERSNRELEQFAYVASHDLQEPLRMVASYTQLLATRYGDKLDKDAREFIAYAVDGANRMQRLISDLLSYSRVRAREKEMVGVDLHSALGEAIANLSEPISETGAVVTNTDLPEAIADRGQMVQLFQNLIGNAIKFHGEEPPRVNVAAERREGEWLVSVSDNGIGIEPQYKDRIFLIFQRLHTNDRYPGTGIGLAICRRIIEGHRGKLWVESEAGKGSTFRFTIPDSKGGYA